MDFKQILIELNKIDKFYSDSTKATDERIKNNPKALAAFQKRAETNRSQADKTVETLLKAHDDNQESQKYLLQIIQDIQKRYNLIAQDTPRLIHYQPHSDKEKYSQYYGAERYQQLMSYCKLAYLTEKNGIPEEHALKLSVMFDDINTPLTYILENLQHNTLAIHDACLFTLPDINHCDFAQWKKFIKTSINDATFRALLPKAAELEEILAENKPEANKKPNLQAISKKKKEIENINVKFKKLDRRHGSLDEEEAEEHKRLLQELAALKLELFKMSAGVKLNEADLSTLIACDEYFMQQTSGAYKYFLEHGLTKDNYAKFLKLERKDDDTHIPNIKLDGKDFGHPGIYLMKVPVLDEMWAAKAACLGKDSNCCQSLSGEAGESCVIHGLTSPYAGFYIVCRGDINHPKVEDKLLAQSWTWRSKNGAIGYDSIETASKDENTQDMIIEFYDQLRKKLIHEKHTHKVFNGTTAGISQKIGIAALFNKKEFHMDYEGYSDSYMQNVVYDNSYPFYWYDNDKESARTTETLIENTLSEKEQPLVNSSFLHTLLNWACLNKNDAIIAIVEESANKYNRTDELNKILMPMKLYLENTLTEEDILEESGNNAHFQLIEDFQNQTPLMKAIQGNNLEFIQKMIAKGASLNQKNSKGDIPFMATFHEQNESIALMLIDQGFNVNEKNNEGKTPLIRAAMSGQADVIDALINKGAYIDEKDHLGMTALMWAASGCKEKIAFKLIDFGANPDIKDNQGNTALTYAQIVEPAFAKRLAYKTRERKAEDATEHSFIKAARHGDIDTITKLIGEGTNINIKDEYGSTALLAALISGNLEIAKILIEKGADVNATDDVGNTALIFASSLGDVDIVQNLLKKGALVNVKDKKIGTSPLLFAIQNHDIATSRLLIDYGADINQKNNTGETPIWRAIFSRSFEIVILLMEKGANVKEEENGLTPLSVAQSMDQQFAEVMQNKIKEMEEKRASGSSPLVFSDKSDKASLKGKANEVELDHEMDNAPPRKKPGSN